MGALFSINGDAIVAALLQRLGHSTLSMTMIFARRP